ncbi:MAG: hypothetical protein JWM19_962 [Actinomycetia bacterium]|nr:hypothetical protein [Actinomycetes bacterium]
MSMPLPPPDTRAAGQPGHIADHNTLSDAVTALESAVGALQGAAAAPGALYPASSQALAAGAVITPVTASTMYPVTATAAVAGIVLAPGSYTGQRVTLVNESSFSVTFAVAGTSNVADGAGDVIAANAAATYTWSGSLWYRG